MANMAPIMTRTRKTSARRIPAARRSLAVPAGLRGALLGWLLALVLGGVPFAGGTPLGPGAPAATSPLSLLNALGAQALAADSDNFQLSLGHNPIDGWTTGILASGRMGDLRPVEFGAGADYGWTSQRLRYRAWASAPIAGQIPVQVEAFNRVRWLGLYPAYTLSGTAVQPQDLASAWQEETGYGAQIGLGPAASSAFAPWQIILSGQSRLWTPVLWQPSAARSAAGGPQLPPFGAGRDDKLSATLALAYPAAMANFTVEAGKWQPQPTAGGPGAGGDGGGSAGGAAGSEAFLWNAGGGAHYGIMVSSDLLWLKLGPHRVSTQLAWAMQEGSVPAQDRLSLGGSGLDRYTWDRLYGALANLKVPKSQLYTAPWPPLLAGYWDHQFVGDRLGWAQIEYGYSLPLPRRTGQDGWAGSGTQPSDTSNTPAAEVVAFAQAGDAWWSADRAWQPHGAVGAGLRVYVPVSLTHAVWPLGRSYSAAVTLSRGLGQGGNWSLSASFGLIPGF